MFFRNRLRILFSSGTSTNTEHELFQNIYSYDKIKRLFRLALESPDTISILLSGLSA